MVQEEELVGLPRDRTMMAAAGVPLRTLQGWMGHADIKTTAIYMHFAPAEEEVQTANRGSRATFRVSVHNCKWPHSFICLGAMSGLQSNSGSSGVFPAAVSGAGVCR